MGSLVSCVIGFISIAGDLRKEHLHKSLIKTVFKAEIPHFFQKKFRFNFIADFKKIQKNLILMLQKIK